MKTVEVNKTQDFRDGGYGLCLRSQGVDRLKHKWRGLMKFEIKSWLNGGILFSCETESLKLTLEAAVKEKINLAYASLVGARLDGASLVGARLDGARLDGARLAGARLDGASLVGARLVGASLDGARGEKLLCVGKRPFLTIGPIGSRNAYLQSFLTDKGVYVRAGCFWNTLDKFGEAVIETHGLIGAHAEEYAIAIQMIKMHAKIWTPVETVKAVA